MDKHLLTVPNLMIAAVAAAGLYAAYRMTKASSGDQGAAASGGLSLLGNPLHLGNNRFYRGRIETKPADGKNQPPFIATTSAADLSATLQNLGFANVKIYMDASQLPSDWPAQAKQGATSLSRFFEGQWSLPTGDVTRPADIALMWNSTPPNGATYSPTTSGAVPGMRLVIPDMRWMSPPNRWGNAPPTIAEMQGIVDQDQAVG
jgi:hypothetical protein